MVLFFLEEPGEWGDIDIGQFARETEKGEIETGEQSSRNEEAIWTAREYV